MSKLESEIKHMQHIQSWVLKAAYLRSDYSAWVQDIHSRLLEWHAAIPQPSKAHPSSIFASQAYWDAIYNNSILLLYRPNPAVLHPSAGELFISFEASCKLIASMKILQREGKIDILWKSVHQLFMAGLGTVYGLWHSKEVRDRSPIRSSIAALQSCASTLSAISEIFPAAAGCRNAFDSLSSATVDWLLAKDSEEICQNQGEFEKQVMDLLQLLQPARGGTGIPSGNSEDYLSTMLSTDNFALGEMLSSAAQWPNFQDMSFGATEPEPIIETGTNSRYCRNISGSRSIN
jgi:hypothetical protein